MSSNNFIIKIEYSTDSADLPHTMVYRKGLDVKQNDYVPALILGMDKFNKFVQSMFPNNDNNVLISKIELWQEI